jgi:hypothetical protein
MNKRLSPVEKIRSAKNTIKQILKMNGIDISHKKIFLSLMIWLITEAYGKHNTDYYSEEVKKIKKRTGKIPKIGVIHEHIYRRKYLVDRLLSSPNKAEEILKEAIACLVTKKEDSKLTKIDKTKEAEGFNRYKEAGIEINENLSRYDKWE